MVNNFINAKCFINDKLLLSLMVINFVNGKLLLTVNHSINGKYFH